MNKLFQEILTECTSDEVEKMFMHWSLLEKWNKQINLTAIRNPKQAAWTHYWDALALNRHLKSRLLGSVLDVGSGPGFPGIPLAIYNPEAQFTLMEPRNKRVSFMRLVVAELGLDNVSVEQGRSDRLTPRADFDWIVSRATFSNGKQIMKTVLEWGNRNAKMCCYRTKSIDLPETEHIYYKTPYGERVLSVVSS